VGSPQTLSEADRPIVAVWAADCADRVLGLFEADAPVIAAPVPPSPGYGPLPAASWALERPAAVSSLMPPLVGVSDPAAVAAARAAGQAASIAHMGAHALGGAAYAAKAAGLAAADRAEAVSEEIRWRLGRMSAAARAAALRQLAPFGENSSGPLGPGLLASGLLGTIIRDLQVSLADPDDALTPRSEAIRKTERNQSSLSRCTLRSTSHSTRPLRCWLIETARAPGYGASDQRQPVAVADRVADSCQAC
jgi:Imm-5 like putative immunity protein